MLFVFLPLADLALLLVLTEATSWTFTVMLALATGALAAYLAKQQGLDAWRRIRRDVAEGRLPGSAALDAAMVLAASALLLTPGVLTDVIGLSMLCPPFRSRYKAWLARWIKSRIQFSPQSPAGAADRRSTVIDSYVVEGDRPATKGR